MPVRCDRQTIYLPKAGHKVHVRQETFRCNAVVQVEDIGGISSKGKIGNALTKTREMASDLGGLDPCGIIRWWHRWS